MVRKVFTIDDERSVRDSFLMALEEMDDIQVLEAENGLQGVELAQEVTPDLVFIDLNMPVMDGPSAIKAIRALHPTTPIYVVTAFAKMFFEQLEVLREEGVEFELAAKPIALEQIQMIVRSVLPAGKLDE